MAGTSALISKNNWWKGGGKACSAINCSNSSKKNSELSFFRYPNDPERCKKWVINVRREGLQQKSLLDLHNSYMLCANHFEDSQFMNPNKKNRLIHCAVPTLFDIPNPPKSVTSSRPPPKQRQPQQVPDKRCSTELAHSPLILPSHENHGSEEVKNRKIRIAALQTKIVRKDIKIRKLQKHFVEIIDGRPSPNFPDPLPACPTSKSMKPRKQPQERNESKSTSQILPDSELCAADWESQTELFDEMEPEQPPHLFLGYTGECKEAVEMESIRARGVIGNSNDFQEEQNSVHDSKSKPLLQYCSALYCSKDSRSLDPRTGNTVDMHPFPDPETDKERCLKWITNLRNDSLNLLNVKSEKVCSLHFGESSYYPFVDGTCTLLPDAEPTRVTRSNEENSDLIKHLNKTIETLQHMLEEEQLRNEGLEEKVSRLEIQRDVNRKELEDANENLRRVCFLASLDS